MMPLVDAQEISASPLTQTDTRSEQENTFTQRYLIYAISILFLVNMINYMDRFIMAILVEPVRREFALSDAESGLLTGLGFTFLYSLLILPVAWLSDRYSRKKILVVAVTAWSILTLICGLASSFVALLLMRAGVGVAESAGLPASHALTSDYFRSEKRAMALSVIGVGGSVGGSLGYLIGGFVSQHYGWRNAFLVAGLPGILLGMVIAFFLREPPRGFSERHLEVIERSAPPQPLASIKILMARKAYMHVVVAATFGALATMGVSAWVPAFYMRVHHIPSDRVSLWLTLGLIFGSFPGMLGGGWLCTRFYRPDGSTLLRVMGVAFIAAPVMGSIVFLERNATLALILYPPLSFSMSLWLAPYYAAQQELAGRQSRAAASAFGLIFYNLIGAGLGPVAVGLISDRLSRHVGTDSLRYALALNLFVCFMALLHLRLARRSMAADLAAANER